MAAVALLWFVGDGVGGGVGQSVPVQGWTVTAICKPC